ncbi:class I SAM-dependent methyltransferase [Pseudonocardia humida]|uniref:Methyltransferase domain-containing protein n=1 Tax=Pseudonocardia humida TaxID=2800819 RepID=A0ABT0ZYT2_9PSEU|nr:class I SAM-dependent methyltransferase [Pseudonocardia humida]MCO1655907.1 methyltransferase domain-containing protein [Pseudonocardia humida]
MGDAAETWARLQRGRGIPPEILAGARANPWHHDPAHFQPPDVPADTPSRRAALDLLGTGGSVLDVGCGGGDAALALAGVATEVVGVDQQADMLAVFATAAAARGLAFRTVGGRWPDVAAEAGTADVVVSHHVLHNVVDLPPFLLAMGAAARRGVVVEMLDRHPMAWLDPLWERFHGLRRPRPATTDDALAVLAELGVSPTVERWERTAPPRQDTAVVTQRLCLPPEREPEVDAALDELVRPRVAATLSWLSPR